jgi:hypothetical protein
VRVRILKVPDRDEIDGVRLDIMMPGSAREVSASVGAWLIAEGFAEFEMRRPQEENPDELSNPTSVARERRRRSPGGESFPASAQHRRRKTD